MPRKSVSKGKCAYCNHLFSLKALELHLMEHLTNMESSSPENKSRDYNYILVEHYDMFLHLLVKSEAKMEVIDKFLRDIWLECCNHMSEFTNPDFKISMSHIVQEIFYPQAKIEYKYDFGTTTHLTLQQLKNYKLSLHENIVLLSRNEPNKILCTKCKVEEAVNICIICNMEHEALFCEKCSEEHAKECEDFAEYACAPVVNSPRMGVCGYEGGQIDVERDRNLKKSKSNK